MASGECSSVLDISGNKELFHESKPHTQIALCGDATLSESGKKVLIFGSKGCFLKCLTLECCTSKTRNMNKFFFVYGIEYCLIDLLESS